MKSLNTFIQEGSPKSCPKGQYYCFTDKKCKKIPSGYFVGRRGYLEPEEDSDSSKKNGKNGSSNGNGNGNGGNGNGNGGNGGGNGGGMSEELNKDDKPFVKKLVGKLRSGSKTHAKQADDLEKAMKEESNPRIPRKKGQPANSKKHSDLYTDENPKGTIQGLGFKDVDTAKSSVSKIRSSSRSHAHKIQAAVAMEQRAREMGKTSEAAVYRKFINSMKKKTKKMNENTVGLHYKTGQGLDVRVNNTSIRNTVDNVKTGVDAVKNIKSDGLVGGIKKTINDKKPPLKAKPSPSKMVDDAISNYKQLNMGEGSLRKWFKGSKSKDGKGGWVNVVTGGTCASDEPGEGTPKCVSSSKRASMTKSERLSASRRKKKADPDQQSKSGAAKPTYVSTDKKKMKEEIQITEADKKGKGSGTKDACYHKVKSRYSVWPSAYASGALVKCRKAGAANWGNKSEEVEIVDEAMSSYDKNRKAAAKRAAQRNSERKAGTRGGRMENETYRNEMGTRMHHKGYKAEEINPTVEQAVQSLDEVSKKTLGSYVKKASTEIGTSAIKGDYKKMQKRHKGVLDASDKLTKEEVVNEKKMVKVKIKDPSKIKVKVTDIGAGGKEYVRKNEMDEGTSYGLYKGSGKAKGAMKDFLDKRAKKLEAEKKKQKPEYKNNPAFGDSSHHSNAKNRTEEFVDENRNTNATKLRLKRNEVTPKVPLKDTGNPVQNIFQKIVPPPESSNNPNVRSGKLKPGKLEAPLLNKMNKTAETINKPIKATSGAIKKVGSTLDAVKGAASSLPGTVSGAIDAAGKAASSTIGKSILGGAAILGTAALASKALSRKKEEPKKEKEKVKSEQVTFQQFQEKCWAGYEKKGMKTMFGKRYPNCVKKK